MRETKVKGATLILSVKVKVECSIQRYILEIVNIRESEVLLKYKDGSKQNAHFLPECS